MPSRRARPSDSRGQESVREELLKSARRLFADRGFEGTSLKELEKATGHNAALVNYYFKSKEGLFRECLQPLFGAEIEDAALTLRSPRDRHDFHTRFELFIERFVETHMRQQDICVILHRDLHTDVVRRFFKQHAHCLHDPLLRFLTGAKRSGIVRKDLDPNLLAKMILSSLFHLISIDRFREELGEPTFLNQRKRPLTVTQITSLFLSGFLSREQ